MAIFSRGISVIISKLKYSRKYVNLNENNIADLSGENMCYSVTQYN